MDEADMTSDRMAHEIEFARKQLTKNKRRELTPIEVCYNCDEELPPQQLFCDADCRKDWERFNANNNR